MSAEVALLVTLGALLIVGPVVNSLLRRWGLPALVGYLALGFGVRLLDHHWGFITPRFDTTFAVLAQLGVVALLFRVGLRSHTDALLQKLPDASVLWLGSVVVPFAFGFLVARYALDWSLQTALVVATALGATSVAVSVSVWDELGLMDTPNGRLLLDVAELDDLSGVVLLALLLAVLPVLSGPEVSLLPLVGVELAAIAVKLAVFVTLCYLFSHVLERRFTQLNRRWAGSETGLAITVLGTGLVIAGLAEALGFSLAIGALFAGLAFSRDPEAVRSDARFSGVYELLTPFFFIYVGMQLDPAVIVPSFGLAAVLFVPAVLGKLLGVGLPAAWLLGPREGALLGVSMVPRAEIAMVIVYACRELGDGLVSSRVFGAMALIAVLTSLLAPPVLRAMLAREQRPGSPAGTA